MQYFNPYYQQPVQQQYNPLQPQYDRLAQMQAQYNQPTFTQQPSLNGEIVDRVDVVRAKNVDMSGNPTFYPKSDMTEIYAKQLQADGTSRIITYKAVMPDDPKPVEQSSVNLEAMLLQIKNDLSTEIAGLKEMIQSEPPKTQRGGSQK